MVFYEYAGEVAGEVGVGDFDITAVNGAADDISLSGEH